MRGVVLGFALAGAFAMGAAARHIAPRYISPVHDRSAAELAAAHDETTVYRTDFQKRPIPVPCPRGGEVILIVGQSNAANYGSGMHRAGPGVTDFYDGHCYAAIDPLLGASGDRGSIWPLVGDQLARNGRQVMLVPLAIGSSRMEEWAPGGRLHARIDHAVSQLAAIGLRPTKSLIVQGEAEGDGHGDPATYLRQSVALIQSLPGKVWSATTTRCWGVANGDIRAAQSRARRMAGASAGRDMDAVPNTMRWNGCHYTGAGMNRLATEWGDALRG